QHARVLGSRGRRTESAQAYRSAKASIEALAERIQDPTLQRSFLAAALVGVPRSRPAAEARAQARLRFDGLTAREREVASLIAAGRTNREIAQTLFLSERTVAVHIANILAKLDFSSRSQVASWATAKGLGGPKALR